MRALIPLWDTIRAKGLDPERLATGTGYSVEHFASPRERISWAAFVRFMANLGEMVGDAELVQLGAAILEKPALRALLLPGRLLYGVPEIYLWLFGPTGPAAQLFVAPDVSIERLAPGELRLELHMKPGYAPSRENHLVLRGSLRGLAATLGATSAEVSQQDLPDGAIYRVRVPAKEGAIGFARRRLGWLAAARSTAEELRRAHEELYQRFVELQREVDARTRAESELRRLNEELERRVAERTAALAAANRELEAFSYSVSHDLRAPLRSMHGFSEVLLEEQADRLDDSGRAHLQRISAAARRMGELIDGLLLLASVNRSELRRERVDLSSLAEAVFGELRQAHPTRAVEAIVTPGLEAEGDARLLRLVLQNFIGNAWKFTSERPAARIELGAEQRGDETAFFVRDNGVGFDMRYRDKLFSAFQRLHVEPQFAGSGIGLATVQRIVDRHGGRVWAESAPDAGATFWFALPAKP